MHFGCLRSWKVFICVQILISCFLKVHAQPVVGTGAATNTVTGVISARWKGFNNPNNTNTALYIGNSNIGSSGTNRVERTGSIYIRPGNNSVSFQYDKTNDRLIGSINGNSIFYNGGLREADRSGEYLPDELYEYQCPQ